MKVHVVEIVESVFEIKGNPTPEMAKEIAHTRLSQESTLDLLERTRTVRTCEVMDEAKDSGVRTPTDEGEGHSRRVSSR